jgi:hypothetical protein
VECHDGDPLHLLGYLARLRRLLLPQTEDILSYCWPAILSAKDKPGLPLPLNLEPIGKPLINTALKYPNSL